MLNAFFFQVPIDNYYVGHQIGEVYKDRIYDNFLIGKKDLTILDIGGNIGITAYYFSQFAKVVHVLEPAEENFQALSEQLLYNKITNVIPHKLALATSDGETEFFHSVNKTMHSLRPVPDPNLLDKKNPSEKVKTIRLDTFLRTNNIDHVDFMKLDVEGSEADIICSDSFQEVANKIDKILLEVHTWIGRNENQLREGLKAAGFIIEVIPGEAKLWIAHR